MSFLNKLKISLKLSFGFGFVLFLTVLIALITIHSLRSSISVADLVHNLVDNSYARINASTTQSAEMNSSMSFYLSPGNQTETAKSKVESNLAAALKLAENLDIPQYQSQVDKIIALTKNFSDN